ncbi:MAG: type VI secretion system baseplate subunit TssE [Gemmataceae bacterium]
MTRTADKEAILPSVLDRLLDPDSGGTVAQRGYTLEQMVAVVQRDLENLLNTRPSVHEALDEYPEVQRSLLAYGFVDLQTLEEMQGVLSDKLARYLEWVVETFEPRLRDVEAIPVNTQESSVGWQYRIVGKLALDPAPAVAFATTIELTTGQTRVEAAAP